MNYPGVALLMLRLLSLVSADGRVLAQTMCIDADEDGEADDTDHCPGTATGRPVDDAGCSVTEFCATIDVTSKLGARICKKADWRNDEPFMRGRDADCRVAKGLPSPADDICIPVIPEPPTTTTTTSTTTMSTSTSTTSTTTTSMSTSTIVYTCGVVDGVCGGTCPEDSYCNFRCENIAPCRCRLITETTGPCPTSTMITTTMPVTTTFPPTTLPPDTTTTHTTIPVTTTIPPTTSTTIP